MSWSETFVALGTPMGESAIAMIRLSGPLCPDLVQQIFKCDLPQPRVSKVGPYHTQADGVLDYAAYLYFEAPKSFTGDHMLELHPHGNPLIIRRIIEDLLSRGCRMAEPGEFTRTAFQNGKLDLTQAEAIADLIYAKSDRALALAQKQLQGALGDRIQSLVQRLIKLMARIEAYIDFAEEDLPQEDCALAKVELQACLQEVAHWLQNHQVAPLIREGIKTAIVGAPNAGKSTLLNTILGSDRAIVSEHPGTTRDFITERATIGDYSLQLIDTAGLRKADCPLETEGITRSVTQMQQADLCLWVIDQSAPWQAISAIDAYRAAKKPLWVILNKADLLAHPSVPMQAFEGLPQLKISLNEPQAREAVVQFLIKGIDRQLICPTDDDLLINVRHADAFRKAYEALSQALTQMDQKASTEWIASDLRLAADHLGEITGKIDHEAVLDALFGSFCIGK
jgi:tRNA modification GTPase